MRSMNRDTILGLATLATGLALLFYGIGHWVGRPVSISSPYLSPRFWPNFIAAMMSLAGAALFFEGLLAGPRSTVGSDVPGPVRARRFILLLTCLAVYGAATAFIGLPLASLIAQTLLIRSIGQRGWIASFMSSLVLVVALTSFFIMVASVPIDLGPLQFPLR